MCGRFGLTNTRGRVSKMFPGVQLPPDLEARYNIAPSQPVLAFGRATAHLLRWGIGGPTPTGTFNLRADTVLRMAPASAILTAGRVVVPASHFYEWTGRGSRRHPVAISRRDGDLLALAALRSSWTDPASGEIVPAVTIITTGANSVVGPYHDRMPVILDPDCREEWRRGEPLPRERLASILVPYPPDGLAVRPVSKLVNDARNDGPQLLEPPRPDAEEQMELLA